MTKFSVKELGGPEQELLKLALQSQRRAHAPYSRFQVGSALIDNRGEYFSGCNVENACNGMGICAERVAISNMVNGGGTSFTKLLVITPSHKPIFPCGGCLQVIAEFALHGEIICVDGKKEFYQRSKLLDLYPQAFSPRDLSEERIKIDSSA